MATFSEPGAAAHRPPAAQSLRPGERVLNEDVQQRNPRARAIGGPPEEAIKYSNGATHSLYVSVGPSGRRRHAVRW